MRCGNNPQRNCNDELQNQCNKRNDEGNPHISGNDVRHRLIEFERNSEIAVQRFGKPLEVALDDSPKGIIIKTIQCLHIIDVFLCDRPLLQLGLKLLIHIIVGQHTHKPIDNE